MAAKLIELVVLATLSAFLCFAALVLFEQLLATAIFAVLSFTIVVAIVAVLFS